MTFRLITLPANIRVTLNPLSNRFHLVLVEEGDEMDQVIVPFHATAEVIGQNIIEMLAMNDISDIEIQTALIEGAISTVRNYRENQATRIEATDPLITAFIELSTRMMEQCR